jgi:transposase
VAGPKWSGAVPVRLGGPKPPPQAEALPEASAAPASTPTRRQASSPRSPAIIEIELPDGVRLRIGEEVGATTLRCVLAALRG